MESQSSSSSWTSFVLSSSVPPTHCQFARQFPRTGRLLQADVVQMDFADSSSLVYVPTHRVVSDVLK